MAFDLTRRAAMAVLAGSAVAGPVWAQDTPAEGMPEVREMVLGNEDADVTVVEYASFTCPHCANFHASVFSDLKANYIDTGKIKFIYREVYFDRYGLWAGMVARCGGEEKYFGIVDMLYARQAEWSRKETPVEVVQEIYKIGRLAGLTDEAMEACVMDEAMAKALIENYQTNASADDVRSTPTFMIDGEQFSNMGYAAFAAILDEKLGV